MNIFISGIKTTTPGNCKRHWRAEWAEARTARQLTKARLLAENLPAFPVVVTITRHSSGKMDKHNLPGALKHVIDGIADAYGIDDGDERWDFSFAQVKCKREQAGVEIRIEGKHGGRK